MLEFTWNGKTISAEMALAEERGTAVASIVSTDVFLAIKISAKAVDEILAESPRPGVSSEFCKCLSAVISLLAKVGNNQARIEDDLARRCFLMLYLASFVMKYANESSISQNLFLTEEDVVASKTYPLTPEELGLVRRLPTPVFGKDVSLPLQLMAVSQNLHSLALMVS